VAEFLTTTNTSARLENIIREANERLVLVSPYVQINPRLFENLKDANKRRVKITLIYGKDKGKLKSEEKDRLHDLQNLSLYFKESLHAKCYYNEKQLIITSMNLYDFSERTNYEMGVLVQKEEDKAIYDLAVEEVEIIRRNSEEIKRPSSLAAMGKAVMGVVNDLVDDAAGTPKKGFCISCAQRIDLDPDRPFCGACYGKWAVRKKVTHQEQYCHVCGKANKTSMSRPACLACYKKQ
jgi:phosphatidylserine/phosphatidylglycerophosphate/cardiolipin synthase-like enzyme